MSMHRTADPRVAGSARIPIAPMAIAILAQVIALGAVSTLPLIGLALPLPAVALVTGVAAAGLGRILGLPAWWLPINLLFVPLALLVLLDPLAPGWYLAAFLILWLLFRSTLRTRVPLYLSSRQACERLLELLPPGPSRVLDLGCGFGGVLARAAAARPDVQFIGVELAPLAALVAWLRLRRVANVRVVHADFWKQNLGAYDLVYAFLSPVAMQPLWHKARTQMRPGSLLVSNSFAVEGVRPDRSIALLARDSRALLVWRM